jgi:hypothetical protein
MSIQDVEKAKHERQTDRYVIHVLDHKTMKSYDSCQLSLDKDGFGYLVTYIYRIRSSINSSDKVFLTKTGNGLSQSDLGHILTTQFSTIFKQLGEKPRNVTSTLIRKSIVGIVLGNNVGQENETDLASLMKHSTWMQNKIYDIRTNSANLARMSSLVYKLINNKPLTRADLVRFGTCNESVSNVEETELVTSQELTETVTDELVTSQELTGTGLETLNESVESESVNSPNKLTKANRSKKTNLPGQSESIRGKVKPWPSVTRQMAAKHFKTCIKNEDVTLSDSKFVLSQNRELLQRVESYTGLKDLKKNAVKLTDLVRSIIKKGK